jgi:hypothetical protein
MGSIPSLSELYLQAERLMPIAERCKGVRTKAELAILAREYINRMNKNSNVEQNLMIKSRPSLP